MSSGWMARSVLCSEKLGGDVIERVLSGRIQTRLREADLPLAVTLWNGECLSGSEPVKVTLHVKSTRGLKALAEPTLGALGRAYVEGDIDLTGDLRDVLAQADRFADSGVRRGASAGWSWRPRSRDRDRKNIQYHYDVSNEFYGLWLDSRRVYSCAYFGGQDESLDDAQRAKLDHICRKLALKEGERLLDIGCGWGGLIFHAAEHYGTEAFGVTLSEQQHAYVREQIRARGLADRVRVELLDYRDIPERETFDKVASVGMFEHVGRDRLTSYFEKIHALLKPGGLLLNHGITSALMDVKGLGGGISEFIEDYVFPGGELCHVSEVLEATTRGGLESLDAENLRPHYARTLWQWVDRLERSASKAKSLVGEKRFRIWRVYMAGSAYAFEHGWLELWQVLAGRPLADGSQPGYPFRRDYMYNWVTSGA